LPVLNQQVEGSSSKPSEEFFKNLGRVLQNPRKSSSKPSEEFFKNLRRVLQKNPRKSSLQEPLRELKPFGF
jgi:hypothetical protein